MTSDEDIVAEMMAEVELVDGALRSAIVRAVSVAFNAGFEGSMFQPSLLTTLEELRAAAEKANPYLNGTIK